MRRLLSDPAMLLSDHGPPQPKSSAVSRTKLKKRESAVYTTPRTRRIRVCMHVLNVCMYSMYVRHVRARCLHSDDVPGPFSSLPFHPTPTRNRHLSGSTFPSLLGDHFVGTMPKSKQNCECTTQARGSKSARLEDQMPKRFSQHGCDARRRTKTKRATHRGKGET